MNKTIKVKYHTDIDRIEKMTVGDWIDLRCAEDISLQNGDFMLVPLGVSMKIPDGYEALLAPRSSTFKRYGIIQTNSIGVIDNSYCGDDDQWCMPVLAMRDTKIHKNDRICQFRIIKNQPWVEIEEADHLDDKSRFGFGSTGI